MGGTWLIRNGMDRERMLDMDERIQPLRARSMAVLAGCLLISGPWVGWWTIVPLVTAALFFRLAERHKVTSARPEFALFAAWTVSEILIAASVGVTGGPKSPAIAWFAIPVVTLSARFSRRGVVAGVAMAITMMIAVSLGVDAAAVIDNPTILLAPVALVIATAILSTAVAESDLEHRNVAVIDSLTGLLNRNALRNRVQEISERSAITGEPVGVIVGDLDRFKLINDLHGHAIGDTVLADTATLLREELRAFDLAYRIGGEEFVVLLPGAGLSEAVELADRLHRAVSDAHLAGLDVTMSFGVDASRPGETFDYDKVFAAADAALYVAKRTGRDRVCVSTEVASGDSHVAAAH